MGDRCSAAVPTVHAAVLCHVLHVILHALCTACALYCTVCVWPIADQSQRMDGACLPAACTALTSTAMRCAANQCSAVAGLHAALLDTSQ